MSNPWNLTPREDEVMRLWIKHGGGAKVIGRELGIAAKTVATFFARACEKIGGDNHTHALLEFDRWTRGTEGKVILCPQCQGSGHVYRKVAA